MKKILFLFILLSFATNAQDLTGRWVAVTGYDSGYYAELYLIHNDDNIYAGHCYDTEKGGYCRHWLDASFDPNTQEFIGLDMELIAKSPEHEPTDYILKYEKGEDGKEYLIGSSVPIPYYQRPYGIVRPTKSQLYELRFWSQSTAHFVRYVKVSDTYDLYESGMPLALNEEEILFKKAEFPEVYEEEELAKLNELNKPLKVPNIASSPNIINVPRRRNRTPSTTPSLPKSEPSEIPTTPVPKDSIPEVKNEEPQAELPGYVITQPENKPTETTITEKKTARNNQVFSHLRLKTSKVTLLIMDYGTIDNDTVTIFYNNKIISEGLRLTDKAAVFELDIVPGKQNELTFVANNLGDVPPNTARITIIADKKRYNYKLFSDEKTNAVILLENINGSE